MRAQRVEDGPMLVPRVLRGASARQDARPFEVAALTPTPAFRLPDPDPAEAFEEAAPPVEAPVHAEIDVEAIRAEVAALWQAKLEEAAARARENGYRQGREDAERATADERALLREHAAQEMEAMKAAWQAHLNAGESMMAELAFEIAETIVGAPLPDNVRRVSVRALREAVEALAGSPVSVSIHPVDRLRLQETGVEEEMRAIVPELRFESDPLLNEGDWLVETDTSSVRHLRAELLDALRRRLGLLALGRG